MFKRVDTTLLVTTCILLVFGLIIFSSAALGVLAVNDIKFYAIIKSQLMYALIGGACALSMGAFLPHQLYKKYGYHFFFASLFLTACVFIPKLAMYHGGAHRWINLGFISLQPSEILKLTFVMAVALWCSTKRNEFRNWKFGLLPMLTSMGLVSAIMLAQPDFGTFFIIAMSAFSVYFAGGARLNHILIMAALGIISVVLLIAVRPYMLERIKTYIAGDRDPRGSSWQLNQSLIAIGSGGFFGRGLGQSIQKFNYLPEPIGDSIFAVAAEELGLIGVIFILMLYTILGIRGFLVAIHAETQFERLLGIGIVTILLSQASLNITSMLGIFPLTGVPLPLMSHGGTALMVALFELGILLHISKTSTI
jgi:cell division protein FtsW